VDHQAGADDAFPQAEDLYANLGKVVKASAPRKAIAPEPKRRAPRGGLWQSGDHSLADRAETSMPGFGDR
jgi:hypothetical protein